MEKIRIAGFDMWVDDSVPKDTLMVISPARPGDPEEDIAAIPVPDKPGMVWRINKRRSAVLKGIATE